MCGDASTVHGEPGRASSAITVGVEDVGDQAVVAIVDTRDVVSCTGTVIAPNVVLTAAHCITAFVSRGARVVFGVDASDRTASKAAPVPAVVLASSEGPARGVAPRVGDVARVVGYGATGGETFDIGRKRRGLAKLTHVDALTLELVAGPSQPCRGDSGGPTFATIDGGP